MKEKTILILCGMVCITFLAWGILLWPTLYRYNKIEGKIIRINKLTGYSEVLGEKKAKMMPQDDKKKIIVSGHFNFIKDEGLQPPAGGYFEQSVYEGNIYNGTSWTIRKIRLSIAGKHKTGEVEWRKTYETSVDIVPFSKGYFLVKLMDGHVTVKPKEKIGDIKSVPAELFPDIEIEKVVGYEGR